MELEREIRLLDASDVQHLRSLLRLFGQIFDDSPTGADGEPDDNYLAGLVQCPNFFAIAAICGEVVHGGLTAHVLPGIKRIQPEVYIYDLAVAEPFRRQGIATALIFAAKWEARNRRASCVFVQAHLEDEPAISLYRGHGEPEQVLHFTFSLEEAVEVQRQPLIETDEERS